MNQLENTPENKAAFFALYYGQEVHTDEVWENKQGPFLVDTENTYGWLSLRSIDSLTDEECIKLAMVLFPGNNRCHILTRNGLVMTIDVDSTSSTEYSLEVQFNFGNFLNRRINSRIVLNYYRSVTVPDFINAIDYLRSISVFIPYMGESDKLIEWGWVKILK